MTGFLDLFSGIGGFALGAYQAGLRFDNHYFSEIDDYAIKVYRKRFPDSIGLGDITKIDGSKLPAGDWIISGGFPCQDISVAGKGAGLAGKRSGLWFEYARLIGELRPRYAIMENVGALSFRGLDAVLGSLAEIGYDAEWQDIRASDVGAPHRRERLWIVAYPCIDARDARRSESAGLVGETGITSRGDDVAYPCGSRSGREFKEIGTNSGRRARGNESALRQDHWQDGTNRADATGAAAPDVAEPSRDAGSGADNRSRTTLDECREWWATEPAICRVAHGVPSRVDRLKCLGNSIVPQIAELIFSQKVFDEFRLFIEDNL